MTITGLQSPGFRHICSALLTNVTLAELWIPANGITASGVWYLMQLLRYNTTLRVVRIDRSSVSRECLEALVQTVKTYCPTMDRLTTGDKEIDKTLAAHFSLSRLERIRISIRMRVRLDNEMDKNMPRWLSEDEIYPVVPRNFTDDRNGTWGYFDRAPDPFTITGPTNKEVEDAERPDEGSIKK